ncbi:ArgS-related anticodon-binding protein NrtL [Streptomyces sp. KLOTTS4A1]|uniref:ArgS-related anticodon-binding protein NrtL n=1 Tax=Streptomyces sp. KLOTTS4A1 TaxID=3390996 RepID=UPI0039F534C1
MTPADLSRTVLRVVRHVVERGELLGDTHERTVSERNVVEGTAVERNVVERILVERPRAGGRGDYACNAALQLAGAAGRPPREVARLLADRLVREPGIADVEITGPGFLNLTLDGDDQAVVREVFAAGTRYGHVSGPTGQVVQLHLRPELRAAVRCDAVRRILRSQGALVRTSCTEPLPEVWAALGIHVDALGTPPGPEGLAFTTPVPAPEQIPALGPDATRWALLHPAAQDRPRMTDRHLVQGESNPLFRVRYAHARSRALSRNAADLGFHAEPHPAPREAARQDLLAALADHPRVLAQAAEHRAPDRLTRHLVQVADALLDFQYAVLPQGDEKPEAAHRARLALAEAAGTVLAGGLSLLGIDAPEYL